MITPEEIAKKQFQVARFGKGYAQEEVDDFLDAVERDYTAALRQAQDAQSRLNAQTGRNLAVKPPDDQPTMILPPVPAGPSMESVALLLQTAQQTAEQIVAKAHSDAAGIVANGHIDAQKITTEATARAQAEVLSLDNTRADLVTKVNDLTAARAAVVGKLEGALGVLAETQEPA